MLRLASGAKVAQEEMSQFMPDGRKPGWWRMVLVIEGEVPGTFAVFGGLADDPNRSSPLVTSVVGHALDTGVGQQLGDLCNLT